MKYEIVPCKFYPGDWVVEAIDHEEDGQIYGARFSGPGANARAHEYAEWKNLKPSPQGEKEGA